jgi:hypothetical protein
MYNSTPEIRMLKSIDKKIDEISTMLDDNIPIIEESVTNSGEKSSTLTLSCLMPSKLETIMKSKVLLQSAIAKTVGAGRNKGMSQPVLGRRSRLTDTYEISAKTSYRDIAKQNFLFLLMERMAL